MSIWRTVDISTCPPGLHRVEQGPSGSVKLEQVKFLDDQRLKLPEEAALVEEVRSAFLHPLAERGEITIWPSTLCQSICRPNSILKNQPRKESNFWRRPSLPNHLIHGRKCLICGGHRVVPTGRMLPYDVVLGELGEMDLI